MKRAEVARRCRAGSRFFGQAGSNLLVALALLAAVSCAESQVPSRSGEEGPGVGRGQVALDETAEPVASSRSAQQPAASRHDGLVASTESGWPQWRGRWRDGISDETGLLRQWPDDGPPLLWKVDGLGTGWSSPVLCDGRLFVTGDVGDDLVIFAFDESGRPLWRATNGRAWKGSYPGARASCVVSEGRLYHLNAHGRLACLDVATGRELWAVNVLQEFGGREVTWGVSECLLVDGPRVLATPVGTRALMVALDKTTGRTVWTTPSLPDDQVSYSSPVLFRFAGRRVVTNCTGSRAFGVDADTGQLLWTVPLRNRFLTNVSTPVYRDGEVYYVTPYAELGRKYRLRPTEDGFKAEHVWTNESLDTVTGGAVLVDGLLYAAGYRRSKWWFAVDWKTGRTKAEQQAFTTGAAIYADERLYVFDERGRVGLLEPGTLRVCGRFQLVQRRVRDAWAHPVLLDGRLYLRYHDTLWCFDVRRH